MINTRYRNRPMRCKIRFRIVFSPGLIIFNPCIMNFVDLHDILICIILSFFISKPEGFRTLRNLGNRLIYENLRTVEKALLASIGSKIFWIHAQIPSIKAFNNSSVRNSNNIR